MSNAVLEAPRTETEHLWDGLREVMDPEIPISLVDLGLIYDIALADGVALIACTFTASACPCMEFIKMDIEERLLREADVSRVEVREVWNPPWTKARVTPEGRKRLKEMGVTL